METDECNTSNSMQKINTSNNGEKVFEYDTNRQAPVYFWRTLALVIACDCFGILGVAPVDSVRSSLNPDDGLGTWTMAASSIASLCMIFSAVFIEKVGLKWTMTLYEASAVLYVISGFYPAYYTMIPAAVLYGLFSGMGFVDFSVYISKIAYGYSETLQLDFVQWQGRFFGIALILGEVSSTLASVVSSLILGYNVDKQNVTDYPFCGADYCNEDIDSDNNSSTVQSTDKAHVYALCGFCMVCALLAVILTFFLSDLKNPETMDTSNKSLLTPLASTLWQLINYKQLLLAFLTIVDNTGYLFWTVEFSKAYVSCGFGVQYVGYIMTCYGLVAGASEFLLGWFFKKKSRMVPIFVVLIIKLAVQVTLLLWNPTSDSLVTMYVITAIWGLSSGGGSLVYALYGDVFTNSLAEAFTGKQLYGMLGNIIINVTSSLLCTSDKIYLQIGLIIAAMVGYLIFEVLEFRKTKAIRSDVERTNEN